MRAKFVSDFNWVILKKCSSSLIYLIRATEHSCDYLTLSFRDYSFVHQPRADHDFEVRLGSAWIKRSHPSVFVKLIYCWQHNWKAGGCRAGGTSTLQSVVFFGRMVNLELHIFLFPVWISHLHGKIFLVCLDFHCVDNIKGSGMGCGKKGVCSLPKCMFLMSLQQQSVSGWCQYMHKVNGHPLSYS